MRRIRHLELDHVVFKLEEDNNQIDSIQPKKKLAALNENKETGNNYPNSNYFDLLRLKIALLLQQLLEVFLSSLVSSPFLLRE